MKLNVGCGKRKMEGYVGMDIRDYGQEIVGDVREGVPPAPNSLWEQIRANHFLEHLSPDEAMAFLNDCHDKCEELYIEVPHKDKDGAFHIDHKTYFTESTFTSIAKIDALKKWQITKLVTNNRKDIHCWMTPIDVN